MKHPFIPAMLACLMAATPAAAQVGASLDAGSTGVGAHLSFPLASSLNGRLGVNYFKHDFTRSSGQLEYDLDGKLQTVDALLDWYPRAGSSFRLTGGVIYNNTRFDAVAEPNGLSTFRLNGTQYNIAEVGILVGKVDFRKAAPYLGIGWGNALSDERGWSFGGDLGAYYQGSARVSLRSLNCTVATAVCQRLASDVAEEQARLAGDVSDYKVYPVLRASLSYRF
ncbi:hypothetical protein [Massilia sp. Se16.2.3]|uniref:hypothetical protein n=1 Tax=Massilia sp. Se16.2.3 TaxID=2709303 RepID=UPI00160394A1|nr:hypothetical protein [Massilia sp. Se16.2.3]QNA99693.1 autotransporter outer membrane beta-barrel domain-containing protein [Massilia sp. Se16.2.3]